MIRSGRTVRHGLASAIALARAGHEVSVHEQAARLEEVGAGLQLGPNAVRALQTLDAWDGLQPKTCAPQAIHVHDAISGKRRATLPLGARFEARFGAPYRVAHRADLLTALAATARRHANIEIVTGQRAQATSGESLSELVRVVCERQPTRPSRAVCLLS